MKQIYSWRVKAFTWEDRMTVKREFDVVGSDPEDVLRVVRGMSPEMAEARIEQIVCKKPYMGGVK